MFHVLCLKVSPLILETAALGNAVCSSVVHLTIRGTNSQLTYFSSVAELEVKTREKLEAAKKKTSFEIAELKERLKASRETINCLKNEIRKLEEDDQTKDI